MSFMPTQERSVTLTRRADVTDPDDRLAWLNVDGSLRDFTDWVLVLYIINPTTNVVAYTKTSGVVGSDGTGKSNVAIAWETAEMTPLVGPRRWLGRIVATQGDEQAEFVLDAAGSLPVWVFEPPPTIAS